MTGPAKVGQAGVGQAGAEQAGAGQAGAGQAGAGQAGAGRAELMRFLVVGGVNLVFTFVVFTVALNLLHLNHLVALLMAWIFGNLLTYVFNFIWVFRPESRFGFGLRFVRYMTAGGVSVGVNLIALYVLTDMGGHDPFWSQVAIMPAIILFNFVAAKFWSLRKSAVQP